MSRMPTRLRFGEGGVGQVSGIVAVPVLGIELSGHAWSQVWCQKESDNWTAPTTETWEGVRWRHRNVRPQEHSPLHG
jgi:hypothetical protein